MPVADDDDDEIVDIKTEGNQGENGKKVGGKDDKDEELEVLPEVSIKIPLRVPPKLLPLMCDVEQHQDHLRENVRNLIVQVGP